MGLVLVCYGFLLEDLVGKIGLLVGCGGGCSCERERERERREEEHKRRESQKEERENNGGLKMFGDQVVFMDQFGQF